MTTTHNLKKIIGGALLSGSVALAGLGMASATAHASPLSYLPAQECSGGSCAQSLIVFDRDPAPQSPFINGPLPEPTGPEWGHQTHQGHQG